MVTTPTGPQAAAGAIPFTPDPELQAAAVELGFAVRELVEASVATTLPSSERVAVAEEARMLAARLARTVRDRNTLSALEDLPTLRRPYSPVTGEAHGWAPPVLLRAEGDTLIGEAVLGLRHEGPPAHSHGGVSALLIDELLGLAAHHVGRWGMTARLSIDYLHPVPLQTSLVLTARMTEASGRKSMLVGTIALAAEPDRHLVRGEALFISPRPEVQGRYFGRLVTADGSAAPGHVAPASDRAAP